MKVLMVNKFLYPNGGSETYIFEIGKKVIELGHEVQYFGMEHEGRIVGNHAESYTSNMDFHTGKLQKLLYPFKILYSTEARKKIRVVLEDFAPDVVHLNNINFQITPAILYEIRDFEKKSKNKIKVVFTAHDYQWVCPNHMMYIPTTGEICTRCLGGKYGNCAKYKCIHGSTVKSILGSIESWLYHGRKTYGLVDTIICPSEFMAEQLGTDPVLKDKLVVMHNFLTEKTLAETEEKEDYVLYFGRYAKEKGIETLLEVCKELPDIPFVFAGSGPLKEEVGNVSNIKDVGFCSGDDLQKLISKARFSVYPSEWYENCPFSVMESQMYGTPVIGADIGGIPELICKGETGELFASGNKSELMEKIKGLWNDLKRMQEYSGNCKTINFSSVGEYCQRLLEDIYL